LNGSSQATHNVSRKQNNVINPALKLVQIAPATDNDRRTIADLTSADARTHLATMIRERVDQWCREVFDDGPRSHLGASLIPSECDRHIWYSFYWIKHKIFSGQMQRLFQRGHLEEERVIQYLRGIGCTVEQVATDTNEQRKIYAVSGHFGGSTDGGMQLPPDFGLGAYTFLLEIKTANDKEFGKMHSMEKSKPEHYKQASVYGYKLGLQYCLYFFVGKNDDDLHIEIVKLDWELAERMITRAQYIIYSKLPPPRISNNASFWVCKMCDHHGVCQLGKPIDRNCRSCYYSQPMTEGDKQWWCNGWGCVIPSKEAALQGCPGWTARQV
jgi:hypothetical protein